MHAAFAHLSHLLPVDRLVETETLLAFHHPAPSYAFHVLLVPKWSYRGWGDVRPEDAALFHDLVEVSQRLVEKFDLERKGYRLIVNGGPHQHVPHLHFHLISEDVGNT